MTDKVDKDEDQAPPEDSASPAAEVFSRAGDLLSHLVRTDAIEQRVRARMRTQGQPLSREGAQRVPAEHARSAARDPGRPAECREGTSLVKDHGTNFIRGIINTAAPEALYIGIAWMGTDYYPVFDCHGHGFFHDHGVTGMGSASNIRHVYMLHYLMVTADFIGSETFAHITVEIDFFHRRPPFSN